MDNKEENKTNEVNHSNINDTANIDKPPTETEKPSTDLSAKSSNADESNNVSPPANGKVVKKKNKGKVRNTAAGNDIDTDLKRLTQRRINVAGAPKMPLNAYVRFMNDRREQLRREQPQRTALEHTKMIGEEWHQLTDDIKLPYIESAAKDKAIYQEQMHKFLTDHPEIFAAELAKAKKVFASTPKDKSVNNSNNNDVTSANSSNAAAKKTNAKATLNKQQRATTPDTDDIPLAQVKRTPTPPPPAPPQPTPFNTGPLPLRPFAAGEIPIYTNEFIEHNRSTENEMRTLRKTKTDLEQQNAVLEQHVDNTKTGHAKVMGDVTELKEENVRLSSYIKGLRQKLASALVGVTLPSLEPGGINADNVDKYIQHLSGMVNTSAAGIPENNAMLLKVGDVLAKMDTTGLQKP